MKKGLKLLLLSLFFLPLGVNAATVDISLSCPTAANASSTVSCTVKATPNGSNLKGLEAKFNITGGTYSSFTIASGWTSYASNQTGFSLGKNTVSSTTSTVGTLKVKMPTSGNAVVKLVDVEGSDDAYDTLTSTGVSKTIRVKSSVNTLESLSLAGATIDFNKNTITYNVTVDAATTTILATKTDNYSTVSGTGKKNLSYGKNTFNVIVTSETGIKKTYTINITRPDNRNTNNNLSSLKISDVNINFNKNNTAYNGEVPSNITKVNVESTLEDSKASYVDGYGNRSINLNYGNNTIKIKVKAENESEKTYTININRKDDRSSNTNLSNITLSSGNLSFDKNLTEYQISVENEIEEIKVSAISEDSKSKVEFTKIKKLEIGNNEIVIKVTAENGDTKEYKITVIRKEENQVLDDNNYLKELTIAGYDIDFNKEKNSYDIVVKDEKELNIKYVTESDKAMATTIGNEDLKDGSVITITVYSESGLTREYNINIKVQTESVISLPIAIGVFVIGLVSFIASVYYFKSKK